MSALSVNDIRQIARQIVLEHPAGIRYRDIVAEVLRLKPNATNRTTIEAQVANNLVSSYPQEIAKPSRGLYIPISALETQQPAAFDASIRSESEFYEPFARFLRNDLEEATAAVALGGAALGRKWGTPDVVGVYRPLTHDLVKFTPEIVVAELKVDPAQPVVAFGQAIAYRLFATRSYVVLPRSITEDDKSRSESLCLLFGIGMVVFNPTDPSIPEFEIRVRAQAFKPDAYYVNEFARRLHSSFPEKFAEVFD